VGSSNEAQLSSLTRRSGLDRRRWDLARAYAESQLHVFVLAFVLARHWPGVFSNAVDPGWARTRARIAHKLKTHLALAIAQPSDVRPFFFSERAGPSFRFQPLGMYNFLCLIFERDTAYIQLTSA